MNTIRFSHNWNNKLNGDIFTTIRKWTDGKLEYYFGKIGQEFTVVLDDEDVGVARLMSVRTSVLSTIPAEILSTDTGMEWSDAERLFKKFGIGNEDKAILLLFKYEVKSRRI